MGHMRKYMGNKLLGYMFSPTFSNLKGEKRYPGTCVIISQICVITVSLKIIMIWIWWLGLRAAIAIEKCPEMISTQGIHPFVSCFECERIWKTPTSHIRLHLDCSKFHWIKHGSSWCHIVFWTINFHCGYYHPWTWLMIILHQFTGVFQN